MKSPFLIFIMTLATATILLLSACKDQQPIEKAADKTGQASEQVKGNGAGGMSQNGEVKTADGQDVKTSGVAKGKSGTAQQPGDDEVRY